MKAMRLLKCINCVAMSVAILSGCGNAWESLTVGTWTEAGDNTAPQYTYPAGQWDYSATSINEGHGPLIAAGDLVQVKIRELVRGGDSINDQHKFWLYVGREKGPEHYYHFLGPEVGYLGSIRIRRALIGHRVGEKFSLRNPPEKQDRQQVEIIPFKGVIGYGIIPIPEVRDKVPQRERNGAERMSKWRFREWSGNGVLAELEVVRSCKAKLLIRIDRLDQWGKVVIIPNPEGHGYSDSRSGELKHIAIEAQCQDSAPIRFQAGPYYEAAREQMAGPGKLWEWEQSYMRTSKEPFVAPLSDDFYNMRTQRIVSDLNQPR